MMEGIFLGTILVLASTIINVSCHHRQDVVNTLLQDDIIGISPAFSEKSGLRDEKYRWSNNTVAYAFAHNYPSLLRRRFYQATQHISSQTCLRFKPRTNEIDYVYVNSGSGCSSAVGRMGGKQDISLPKACTEFMGVIVHELVHSLGFFHEMSRPDRDRFVRVHFENVKNGHEHNFVKLTNDTVSTFNVDYDFSSLMHYGSHFFSKNGEPTITTIPEGIAIGQVEGLSPKDILKINRMYKCKM